MGTIKSKSDRDRVRQRSADKRKAAGGYDKTTVPASWRKSKEKIVGGK